jgi:arsenite methyltransferase
VIAVDMTGAMRDKARAGAAALGLTNVEVRHGYAEELPVASASVDVVISNGVINLCPDKVAVMREVYRVLRPGGRFQIGDIVVHKDVPQGAKDDIDLWSG